MTSQKMYAVILIVLLGLLILPVSASLTAITSTPQTIVKGDRVILNGTDARNGTYGIWVIGRNYFDVKTVNPDKKGTFTFTLKPEETGKFSTGQYAVLIQDPGTNQNFEIEPLFWADGIKIANKGKIVNEIGLTENLRANVDPAVTTILDAASRPETDDIFTPYYFYVEEPFVHFNKLVNQDTENRLPSQTTGEDILISGTTNIGVENTLMLEIHDQNSRELVTAKTIPVIKGDSSNKWFYELDSPGLQTGEYYITVGWQKSNATSAGTSMLSIHESRIIPVQQTNEPPEAGYGPDIIVPLIISAAALILIGIIMIVSLKR